MLILIQQTHQQEYKVDLDTLKSVAVGSGGITIQFLDMLPDMVRVGVGIITIVYFGYKIALLRKQLKN